jgi:DNA-binding transcriptional ArsR family regulator
MDKAATSAREVPASQCTRVLKALADPTRWRIVHSLLAEPATLSQLMQALHVSHYNVSKHIAILEQAGLVRKERRGRSIRCSVAPDARVEHGEYPSTLDLECCTFRFEAEFFERNTADGQTVSYRNDRP